MFSASNLAIGAIWPTNPYVLAPKTLVLLHIFACIANILARLHRCMPLHVGAAQLSACLRVTHTTRTHHSTTYTTHNKRNITMTASARSRAELRSLAIRHRHLDLGLHRPSTAWYSCTHTCTAIVCWSNRTHREAPSTEGCRTRPRAPCETGRPSERGRDHGYWRRTSSRWTREPAEGRRGGERESMYVYA